MDNKLWLRNICRKNNFEISDEQLELLQKFCEELSDWNRKVNLISRRDEENVWSRHVLGSVSFLFRFQFEPECSILDLGTGGGLPGIPLAILCPDLKFMLVDSIQKKTHAVNDILEQLRLPNVTTMCSRAEELSARKEFKHSFDYIIARAVGPIHDIVKWSRQLVKTKERTARPLRGKSIIQSGSMVLLKGGELSNEIEDAKHKLKLRDIQSFPIIVDGIDVAELADKKLVIVYP